MVPAQLMNGAATLAGIPGIIVQGRYDLLCPPPTAHALAARWRDAEVRSVEGAGHTLYDPGVRNAVMKALADVASRIGKESAQLSSSCPARSQACADCVNLSARRASTSFLRGKKDVD